MRKKNRFLCWLLVFCLLIGCMPMTAGAEEPAAPGSASGTCGANATWSYDAETETLTVSGAGEMADYQGPDQPYANLQRYAKTIIINPGITSVGAGAFWCFQVCTAVSIPESVKKIGDGAFGDCNKLPSVSIPKGVEVIGTGAFEGCIGLSSVSIPEGVEVIGDQAFNMCHNLVSVEMGDSVVEIGDQAFSHCWHLASVKFSKGLKKIGANAFLGDAALTSIEIPEGVEDLAGFDYCDNLTTVTVPEGVTSLGKDAFSHCHNLYAIEVPKSVKQIDITAFKNDGWLTIYGEEGSYVETFAKENGIPFVAGKIPSSDSVLARFKDVSAGKYYTDAVIWAALRSITAGTDDTHFSPNRDCTRAQAVTFLWRAAGSPEPNTRIDKFTDVPAGAYYETALRWAVETDITAGTSETQFSPNRKCTRAQIVTFLWRMAETPDVSGSAFTDVSPDAYYAKAVSWAVSEKITQGATATKFNPNSNCTRGQIVAFLYRNEQQSWEKQDPSRSLFD